MAKKNNKGPYLPYIQAILAAGIDPKTGLPIKSAVGAGKLKQNIKHFLRIVDEQDAVNRYKWTGLPCNITSQELERLIYYKGQICFFYDEALEKFYFMPYALDGTIDYYGRYNTIHPVPMTSGTDEEKKTDAYKAQEAVLSMIKLKCIYGEEEAKEHVEDKNVCCVLLHDYTKQLAQEITPRVTINDPILDTMAECIPFMRTALIAATGVRGVRVQDADQASSVEAGSRSMENAALTGKPLVPIIGKVEFQDLTNGHVTKSEEYMLAMQSLDNLRLSGYGLDNGGLFEKKAHELQAEADINGGPIGLISDDGLSIRKNFCVIANALWGLSMNCEINDKAVVDKTPEETDEVKTTEEVKTDVVEEGGNTDE